MDQVKVFLDTSVLLTAFGIERNGGNSSYILDADDVTRMTFEKCVYECFLAFRGVGGKKPDEGRQDWAKRFLKRDGDPVPLSDAAGKLHEGSILSAHYMVGQSDEAQWAIETLEEYYRARASALGDAEQRKRDEKEWNNFLQVIENHLRYQSLFSEFRNFLSAHSITSIHYEELYDLDPRRQYWRIMTMEGLSQRSTIPSEDFEIVVAALSSEVDLFVSTDRRLLTATASIETNLRRCYFIHLEDVRRYIEAALKGQL